MSRHLVLALSLCLWAAAAADELVYEPVNPAFGGDPFNGAWLLNSAQAQDTFEEDIEPVDETQSRLDNFFDLLERSVLSRLASALTGSIVGQGGDLQPGTVETQNFVIEIVDTGGGQLTVFTTDKVTGESTEFQVDNLP
jgi:curli production assembly/transport component CsgF